MKMRTLMVFFSLLIMLFLSGFSGVEQVTEETVHAYLERMERAFNNRDSDAVAVLIAPEARIELEQATKNGSERMSLSREEYRSALHGGLAQLEGYQYVMKNKRIAIAGDATSADVSVKVVESYSGKGKRMVNETACKYKLVLKRGKITAVLITAKGKGQ